MPRQPHSSLQALKLFAALLHESPSWVHGYSLAEATGLKSGTLYPLLMRLADAGLLEARWEPSAQTGRPPRHLYRLTGNGRVVAEERIAEKRRERSPARIKDAPA